MLFLCIAPLCALGQYSYYKGASIVTTDSAATEGYVERISESDLSLGVRFKKSIEEAKGRTIPMAQIDRVIFTDDSAVFEKVKYTHVRDSSTVTEYRLAKKLLCGYAGLFKLQLPDSEVHIVYERNNTFVYIVRIGANFHVLDQAEVLDTTSGSCIGCEGYAYKLKKTYINVLRRILKDDQGLSRRIPKLKLRDADIIPLIDDFNKTHPEVPREILFRKEKAAVRHSVSLATPFLPGLSIYGFQIGYLAKIYYPNISEKISSDLGVSYVSFSRDFADNSGTESISGCRISAIVAYHFNNLTISPYAGLGLSMYLLEYIPLYSVRAVCGVNVFKKFNIGFETDGALAAFNFGFEFAGTGGSAKGRPR
jgi:hypothetical protein